MVCGDGRFSPAFSGAAPAGPLELVVAVVVYDGDGVRSRVPRSEICSDCFDLWVREESRRQRRAALQDEG